MKTLTVYEPGGDCGWDEAKCEEILADATDDHGAIDASEIVGAIQDVIHNGEYGQMDKDFTGCTVTAEWAVIDGDGEEEDGGTVDIDLLPGDVVRVRSVGQRGVVLSGPDGEGRLQVAVGTVRMEVAVGDVEVLEGAEDTEIRTNARELHIVKSLTAPREIMLRGLTVDEALSELERFMDDAALAQHDRVHVIHGKGTGALREAVHAYLRQCPLAVSFEFASPSEGGIGVTVVRM